jgi:hypothetical protein
LFTAPQGNVMLTSGLGQQRSSNDVCVMSAITPTAGAKAAIPALRIRRIAGKPKSAHGKPQAPTTPEPAKV